MELENQTLQKLRDHIDVLQKENAAFRSNEKMFHALVETAVGDIGEEFFSKIVHRLSEWLNAECIIIGLITGKNIVEGFPMLLDGKIINGFTYHLQGTPCDLTSRKGYCIYPENVIASFPGSKDLIELNIEGYVGTALYNKKGEASGVLCAMSRKRLNLPPQAEDIMRIVASRITAEIERIKAIKALEISESSLRSANASKDRLFTIIAHDLKSPFNSLIGFSRVLIDHVKRQRYDKVGQYAQIIHDVSSQTHTLLSNLLEWSMIRTDNIIYDPKTINLSNVCSEVVNLYINQANQKNITLTSSVMNDHEVFADISMLHIILRNLISNAIKYSFNGGAVTLTAVEQDDSTTIIVSDAGIGIDPENVKKLFQIETSFTTTGTCDEKGTGLGLVLCKDLVEKHKGKIWVESKSGSGSSFRFTLPKEPAEV